MAPLTKKGRKIMRRMRKHYGKKQGKRIFYMTAHKKRGWHKKRTRRR